MVVILVSVIGGMFVLNIQHHKCGKNLKWSYDKDSKTLTIAGNGPMYDDFAHHYQFLGLFYTKKSPWHSGGLNNETETIVIQDGCTHIGDYSFEDFNELKNIAIPDSVVSIGDGAFLGCGKLEAIELPKYLESVDKDAFWCGVKSLYFPETVEYLSSHFFGQAQELEDITVAPGNLYYSSLDGVLFNKDRTELLRYPVEKKDEAYSVPDGVRWIEDDAFLIART